MYQFFVLSLVGWAVANASPVSNTQRVNSFVSTDGGIACHRANDYSAEWFLQNTIPKYSSPLQNTALFYSAGMSKSARALAKENKLITIWDLWPCFLYNHHEEPTNPLRCIHNDDTERQLFFTHMSRAFAMKARNFSTVLHSSDNYPNPPSTGIWGTVEFPALQRGGLVEWLEKVDDNKKLKEIFWRKPNEYVMDLWNTVVSHAGDLKKRALGERRVPGPPSLPKDFAQHCLTPKELDFFDNVSW